MWVTGADGARSLSTRTSFALSSLSWGRGGVLAQELAWAMLFDSTQDRRLADDWFSVYSADVVAGLPHLAFWISADSVRAWLEERGSR